MLRRCCSIVKDVRKQPHRFQRQLSYQSIGSFHSEDISTLLGRNLESTLAYPSDIATYRQEQLKNLKQTAFGRSFKEKHYMIDPECTFLNHGAFGACMKSTLKLAELWRRHCEVQPLRFFDRELFPFVALAMQHLGKFLKVQPQDLVFVPNATAALNSVLRSLATQLKSTEKLLYFDTTYGSVKKMIEIYFPNQHMLKPIPKIESKEQFLSWFEKSIASSNIKVVLLDHVSSNTACLFPIKEMVQLCHAKNIVVIVDGAHGLLHLDLSLEDLEADYYIGNCHKWLGSPKGCGFLYQHPRVQSQYTIRPTIISHGYEDGVINSFLWDGCRDYMGILTLPFCLEQWQTLGIQKVRNYMHKLGKEASDCLTQQWNTSLLYPNEFQSAMQLIELPRTILSFENNGTLTSSEAKQVQDYLYLSGIEVPVKCIHGKLYIRLSCHVYNEMQDILRLNDVIQRNTT